MPTLTPSAPNEVSSPYKWELIAVLAGLLVMYVPTYITLSESIWKVVGQGHGPVMLALTIWLIWQRGPAFLALRTAANPAAASVLMALGLAAYIIGHSQEILLLEVGSQLFVLAAVALSYKGLAGLKLMWFPIFFMLFLIPIPGSIVDIVTGPLKMLVSIAAENLLYAAGYPIGRSGVTLTIGSYQLLVADACAGLNSIFALEAIGVFYLSIVNYKNNIRNIAIATLIMPISFVANVTRVIILVLVTYYFGDEAGQGFIHGFAGIILFMIATALTIGVDHVIGLFIKDNSSRRP